MASTSSKMGAASSAGEAWAPHRHGEHATYLSIGAVAHAAAEN